MRKLLWSFLLPFVLLLSQQGALVHELNHLRADATTNAPAARLQAASGQTDAPAPSHAKDTLCALCLGFNHLASPVASALPALVLLDLRHTQRTQTTLRWLAQTPPTARSRGPPLVL